MHDSQRLSSLIQSVGTSLDKVSLAITQEYIQIRDKIEHLLEDQAFRDLLCKYLDSFWFLAMTMGEKAVSCSYTFDCSHSVQRQTYVRVSEVYFCYTELFQNSL